VNSENSSFRVPLQGWIPELASEEEIRTALEKAFDYRGDITLTLKSGDLLEGYIFDRRCDGPNLEQCVVRLFPKGSGEKVTVRYSDIARLEFSGRDTAEGRHFQDWIKKYREKKARGEKNISLEPETLD
jgi:hypothetical protein